MNNMGIAVDWASRFQAGERLAMRHWLLLRRGMSDVQIRKMKSQKKVSHLWQNDTIWLIAKVKELGGDPEALCKKGRDRVQRSIEREYGGM